MLLSVLLLASILLATTIGAAHITIADSAHYLWAAATGSTLDHASFTDYTVVTTIRLPRAILAALVGAGLSVLGIAAQTMVRNPLADPFILGISSGASIGAAAVITLGLFANWGIYGLSFAAFCSALLASAVVYSLAWSPTGLNPTRLILIGVVISFGFQGITSAIVFFEPRGDAARTIMFWLLGSFGGATWSQLPLATTAVIASIITMWWLSTTLDVLSAGDASALSMGINPKNMRRILFIIIAIGTGTLVAISGTVGFVGLVVPHIVRMLCGPTHRTLVLLAPLIGAILMVWVDIISRSLVPPRELPIGIVTALIGVPLFIVIIRSTDHTHGGTR